MVNRSQFARYGLAFISVAVAVGVRESLTPFLQGRLIFGLAFCAVVATSWFGGRGPGLLSVLLGSFFTWYLVLPPSFSFTGKQDTSSFQVGVFVFVSSVIAILTGSLRKANDRLEDREAHLRFIAAAMPEILFTADAAGRVETLSERFFEFAGISRSESTPQGWLDWIHPDERDSTLKAWSASVAQQTEFRATCRLVPKDGAGRWFQCRAVPMVDKRQRVIRWVGVCADIHDHKVLEEALARSNEDLQRFAFAASHDLQEPLKMIGVFSELLIRKQAENTESNYLVAQITRGVRRMQELIQSTLEYSRIRAEDVGMLSEISLEQPLSEAVWSLQNAIAEARAEITSDPLPMVVADAGMISRVFQNLIQNAIRFRNDEPPQIRIGSRTEKDTVVVFVSDNGIGIAKDYAESVFEPFRRLHPQGGQRGSGLGLTSVKRIIELHRGRVWLESEPGKGSTFFFTLPLARNRANGDTAGGMASRPAMA